MRAMVLEKTKQAEASPLLLKEIRDPSPDSGEVLIEVSACAVCRTDLHVVEGELSEAKLPLVPGHQIVGKVIELGDGVTEVAIGERVGVAWLNSTCGKCQYCRAGTENLCDKPLFTGYTVDGGFAELAVAKASFVYSIPDGYGDLEAAPLLCAGLIGFRALRMTAIRSLSEQPPRIGLYGFGSAARLVTQVATYSGYEVYVFTRPGDSKAQSAAKELGATWAGGSADEPPCELDATVIFAPVGALIPRALKALRKGGSCVCAGIHMSPIPGFHYSYLWGERVLRSVANLTRQDGVDFLELAPQIPVKAKVETFELSEANRALQSLKSGELDGTAVLVP